jgi:DNA-binding NarL/FixJ family response regulator
MLVPMRPTVLIVDDHPGFRRAARALLAAEGVLVVGEAGDADEAIAEARRLRPDVVLLDIQLRGTDGFAVAERMAEGTDPPVVILISTREESEYGGQVGAARVAGFIPKRSLNAATIRALAG